MRSSTNTALRASCNAFCARTIVSSQFTTALLIGVHLVCAAVDVDRVDDDLIVDDEPVHGAGGAVVFGAVGVQVGVASAVGHRQHPHPVAFDHPHGGAPVAHHVGAAVGAAAAEVFLSLSRWSALSMTSRTYWRALSSGQRRSIRSQATKSNTPRSPSRAVFRSTRV